jgi:hypothetical protein
MKHIRAIATINTNTYTIVKTDDWTQPLEEHPCILEHPELYEVADCEIPSYIQYLIYNQE